MKRALKIGLWSTFVLALVFMITLVVHIGFMVGNRPASSFYQLGRVDFANPVNQADKDALTDQMETEEGFISAYFNDEAHTMVYKIDTRYNNAGNFFENAVQKSIPDSKRYIVTAEMEKQGCPVIRDDSFYGRLTAMVTNVMY